MAVPVVLGLQQAVTVVSGLESEVPGELGELGVPGVPGVLRPGWGADSQEVREEPLGARAPV